MKADSLHRRLLNYLPHDTLAALSEALERDPNALRRRLAETLEFRAALAEGATEDEARARGKAARAS